MGSLMCTGNLPSRPLIQLRPGCTLWDGPASRRPKTNSRIAQNEMNGWVYDNSASQKKVYQLLSVSQNTIWQVSTMAKRSDARVENFSPFGNPTTWSMHIEGSILNEKKNDGIMFGMRPGVSKTWCKRCDIKLAHLISNICIGGAAMCELTP